MTDSINDGQTEATADDDPVEEQVATEAQEAEQQWVAKERFDGLMARLAREMNAKAALEQQVASLQVAPTPTQQDQPAGPAAQDQTSAPDTAVLEEMRSMRAEIEAMHEEQARGWNNLRVPNSAPRAATSTMPRAERLQQEAERQLDSVLSNWLQTD